MRNFRDIAPKVFFGAGECQIALRVLLALRYDATIEAKVL
jgi:hypothetical protein